METINLKINGIAVTAPKYHYPGGSKTGTYRESTVFLLKEINEIESCHRICIVELKNGKLVTSCVYPIEEGMEVSLCTPKFLIQKEDTSASVIQPQPLLFILCPQRTREPGTGS